MMFSYGDKSPLYQLMYGVPQGSENPLRQAQAAEGQARVTGQQEELKILLTALNRLQGAGGGGPVFGGGGDASSGGDIFSSLGDIKEGNSSLKFLKKLFGRGPSKPSGTPYDPSGQLNSLDFTSTLNFTPGATGFTATGGSVVPTMALYYAPSTYRKPLSRQT